METERTTYIEHNPVTWQTIYSSAKTKSTGFAFISAGLGEILLSQIIAHVIAGVAMPFSGGYSGPDRTFG
jgi:hypothetical protein